MKTTETPITEVEQAEKAPTLNEFQLKALEDAEKALEALKKETDNKKYLVDLKKEDIALLVKFNKSDAPWKFTECLGIVEVEKQLATAVKEGKLYCGAIAIEAMYYYLSKVEGKGNVPNGEAFSAVEDFIRVLKAITSSVERIKIDNEKLRNQEFIVAARREGINTDVESGETAGE